MKIGINFYDNDFGSTQYNILEYIKLTQEWAGEEFSKEDIIDIIKRMIPVCCRYAQPWGREESIEQHQKTVDYLLNELTEKSVLLNAEVNEFLSKNTWNNSEMCILDTSIHCKQIYYI